MSNGKGVKRQRKKELRRERIEQQMRQRRVRRRRMSLLATLLIGAAITAFLIQSSGRERPATERAACTHSKPAGGNTETPDQPPEMTIDPAKIYTAEVETSCGSVEIELAAQTSPNTVNSFVYLANRGFYNGLPFHRVVRDFAIQGGDPMGDGSGGPNYKTVDVPPADFKYVKGTVAMAKAGPEPPGTAGSQFFIVPGAKGEVLPAEYAVLGKVVGGQRAVDALNAIETRPSPQGEQSMPAEPIYISKITVKET
jgi:cyclophilin family peptidyl-prolyl cis-trans isomerase